MRLEQLQPLNFKTDTTGIISKLAYIFTYIHSYRAYSGIIVQTVFITEIVGKRFNGNNEETRVTKQSRETNTI